MSFIFEFGIKPRILKKVSNEEFISNKINPKVSIITTSFNQGKYIEDCIISVGNQSYKDFEHIILDNLSTDETKEVVSRYPHVTFISEKDRGHDEATIKASFLAKGKYIIWLPSSDGILDENWLRDSVEILEKDNELSMVWGLVQRTSESGILHNSLHHPQFWDVNHPNYTEVLPQKEKWFDYWRKYKLWGFEISMVVRKEIFLECYVQAAWNSRISIYENNFYLMDFLEFLIFFGKKRYQAYFLKKIACFARNHEDSIGTKICGDTKSPDEHWSGLVNDYFSKIDLINKEIEEELEEKNMYKNFSSFYKSDNNTLDFSPDFEGKTNFKITIYNEICYEQEIDCAKNIHYFISSSFICHQDSYLEFNDVKIKINENN